MGNVFSRMGEPMNVHNTVAYPVHGNGFSYDKKITSTIAQGRPTS
jgi:hypothetical protein